MARQLPVPASLLIDDGAPVNLMHWHCPWETHERLIPNRLAKQFAELCERHEVKGKFSVVPMPAALGRIDQKLAGVCERRLGGFLEIVRRQVAPRFDITPELLTHLVAFDPSDGFQHVYEDAWVARASADEIADYIALALKVLAKVGLKANGVTSPWNTGHTNEKTYAEGIGRAFARVQRRKMSWFFRTSSDDKPLWPSVKWRDRKRGLKVVSVPVNAGDVFWHTQYGSVAAAKRSAKRGVDQLLSANGKQGCVRELVDAEAPVTILTHWQSLFSNGRMAGLAGLKLLLERMTKHLAGEIRWMRCGELAKLAR